MISINLLKFSAACTRRVSFYKKTMARLTACVSLLLCGVCAIGNAQTAYFSGAQTILGSGFHYPAAVAVDSAGDVFVADDGNSAVKEILAVNGTIPASPTILTLGSGISNPDCVAVDSSGNVYVCDTGHGLVKEILAVNGSIPASPTIRTLVEIEDPAGVVVDGNGDVFLAGGCPFGQGQGASNCGLVAELPAVNGSVPNAPSELAVSGGYDAPFGLTFDNSGNLYVADELHNTVEEIAPVNGTFSYSSNISSLVYVNGSYPTGVAVDGSGDVFVADSGINAVYEYLAVNGSIPSVSPAFLSFGSGLSSPTGVALDRSGNIYITDLGNNRVLKESLAGADFGGLNVGTTSPAMTLNFTFATAGTLSSVAVLTGGVGGLDFANTGTGSCKANMAYAAHQVCTINVTFTPSLAGTRTGSALLYGSTGSVIATGLLSGVGIRPAATPAISPATGTYASAQSVTITDATPGASIYYTTDGTTPTISSAIYSGPIMVSATEAVEAIALASGYTQSAVVAAGYTIQQASSGPPPVPIFITGSSSFYLEAGQASLANQGCSWTTASRVFSLSDSRLSVSDLADAWITWQPSGGDCTVPLANSEAIYLDTDSVVGTRCFFASPRCTISTTVAAGTAGTNILGNTDTPLPAAILNAISGASVNVAATEIRPEDAKFATLRALAPCGTPVVPGSQYLGIGFSNGGVILGSSHQTSGGGGGFKIADFNLMGKDPLTNAALTGSFAVTSVAAAPVLVVVNPRNETGFGSLLVSNVDRGTLAGYLDGTYGSTADLIPQSYQLGGSGANVYLREFLSGTYNTMEYAIPDSVENQSSQEVGLAGQNAIQAGNNRPPFYCSGGVWQTAENPLNESLYRSSFISGRYRAIGTAAELAAVESTNDGLGYATWSPSGFATATASNMKYLTVDGIDPIQQNWTDGLVPTAGNDLLGNVTFAHIKDGSYPIWSILRLVSDPQGSAGYTAATTLAQQATAYLSPSQPNFVPFNQLTMVRSHFAPPGVNFPSAAGANVPANGTSSVAEAGGDVGGLVYSLQADSDYNKDNGVNTGNTGHRQ